jgi:hypothetical protein
MTWAEQVVGTHRPAAGGEAEAGERAEDDFGQRREVAEDQREGADIEDLLEEPADDVVVAAHRPEQPGQRDVDPDQHARQECDVAAQQREAAVDVLDEDAKEAVDDVEIVHRVSALASRGAAGPRGRGPAAGAGLGARRRWPGQLPGV